MAANDALRQLKEKLVKEADQRYEERQITKRMEDILRFRRMKWSYRKIADVLGIHFTTVRESHQRALDILGDKRVPKELSHLTPNELARLEELDYIEGVLEQYMKIADDTEQSKPRTAIEALNGAHRYLQSLIEMKAINPPKEVHHRITIEDLKQELLKIESEIGEGALDEVIGEIDG